MGVSAAYLRYQRVKDRIERGNERADFRDLGRALLGLGRRAAVGAAARGAVSIQNIRAARESARAQQMKPSFSINDSSSLRKHGFSKVKGTNDYTSNFLGYPLTISKVNGRYTAVFGEGKDAASAKSGKSVDQALRNGMKFLQGEKVPPQAIAQLGLYRKSINKTSVRLEKARNLGRFREGEVVFKKGAIIRSGLRVAANAARDASQTAQAQRLSAAVQRSALANLVRKGVFSVKKAKPAFASKSTVKAAIGRAQRAVVGNFAADVAKKAGEIQQKKAPVKKAAAKKPPERKLTQKEITERQLKGKLKKGSIKDAPSLRGRKRRK